MRSAASLLPLAGLASAASVARDASAKCTSGQNNYDFIVVGGGTAGLAVASRLSTYRPHDCILVIESGPSAYDEPKINVPGMKGSTLGGPLDWNFTTTEQPNLDDRKISVNRGKVLGGSSALNLMTWDRASVADYDAWQELGNPGWNFTTFIAAMEAVETFHPDPRYGDKGVGHSGPIHSLINRVVPPQQDGFIPALNSLGAPNNTESLDGNNIGVMIQPSNVRYSNYTRSYSPTYLTIAGPNLHVMTNTSVDRIETSSKNGEINATGVCINGNTIIKAKKEVILSAGSVQTPGLLENSGIGNKTIIEAAGIDSILDLPGVGENFQDHLRIQNSYRLKPEYKPAFDELHLNATYAAEQLSLYNSNKVSEYDYTGSGYSYITWEQASGINATGLTALARESADPDNVVDQKKLEYLTTCLNSSVPELEIIFSDGYTGAGGYPAKNSSLYGAHFFTLIGVVQHPFSRGSIHINASNPSGHPIINPNYLSKPYDLLAVTEITKFNRRIAEAPALRKYWIDEYEPGMDVNTDAEWTEFAKKTTLSIYHPQGTCAMLPQKDNGVVDPKLMVYGTSNLRIVDASVIPVQPSAHIQTMVYGIAEMAAKIIADKYN